MKLGANHLLLYQKVQDRGVGRCCNDLEPDEVALLSKAEWKELCRHYHTWNGDPETFEERTNFFLYDFMVIGFIQHLLLDSYKKSHGL